MIYIGNSFFSFNNGVGWHVSRLHASANPGRKLRSTSATITGSGLDWHDVDSYFRPNAVGAYSFDADNNVVFNRNERLFDVALMMDCSLCPIHPVLGAVFRDFARKHSGTVRKHGARPALFMSWAYADRPDMTDALAEAYTSAGNDNDALVIPAGLAFARVRSEWPRVDLYIEDKRHPSLAGTYLAASTVYAALFRRSPVGLAYGADLDAKTASVLQEAAWATVQDFYGT